MNGHNLTADAMAIRSPADRHIAGPSALRAFYTESSRYNHNRKIHALLALASPVLCWTAVFGTAGLFVN